jgi:hypothetical protein
LAAKAAFASAAAHTSQFCDAVFTFGGRVADAKCYYISSADGSGMGGPCSPRLIWDHCTEPFVP